MDDIIYTFDDTYLYFSISSFVQYLLGNDVVVEKEEMRTDRTGLSTARRRLSAMVVAHSIRAARLKVMKKILLPADPETSR